MLSHTARRRKERTPAFGSESLGHGASSDLTTMSFGQIQ